MYPDEFVQLLRKHKAPRWHTIGVTSSQVTNWQRQKDTPILDYECTAMLDDLGIHHTWPREFEPPEF